MQTAITRTSDPGRVLLAGGDRTALRAGARVSVTGRSDPNLLSTCRQGEPPVVASVEPAR